MLNIPQSINIGFLTIHFYGIIMAVAVIAAWLIANYFAKKYDEFNKTANNHNTISTSNILEQATPYILIFGLIGARFWHVITDWQLYWPGWQEAFFIWQGGLSILGAVTGGVIGWLVFFKQKKLDQDKIWLIPDVIVLSLPFAQAIGRIGNWINQELFGLPTNLPWGIWIDHNYRPLQFINEEKFHPLFAYEAILMLATGLFLWWLVKKRINWLGTGFFTIVYLFIYSTIRFMLDFLRIEKSQTFTIFDHDFGINQLILIFVIIISIYLLKKWWLSGKEI